MLEEGDVVSIRAFTEPSLHEVQQVLHWAMTVVFRKIGAVPPIGSLRPNPRAVGALVDHFPLTRRDSAALIGRPTGAPSAEGRFRL